MGWGRVKLRGVPGAAALAMLLAGCGGGDDPAKAEAMVPSSVQVMMDAQFPADGQIHVQSRGKIVIQEATVFCHSSGRISGNLMGSAPRLDLSPGFDGMQNAPLNREWGGETCKDNGTNLVSDWVVTNNRNGAPYKLVLAVWQGDPGKGGAVWVGGVERGDGIRADDAEARPPIAFAGQPLPTANELRDFRVMISIRHDVDDVSQAFVGHMGYGDSLLNP